MSLLQNKLASLTPGTQVRLTHTSGQIIEGVVAENDKTESLSVQITSLATLRYDQISLLDVSLQAVQTAVPVIQPAVSVTAPAAEEIPVHTLSVMEVTSTADALAEAFKALSLEQKHGLQQANEKMKNGIKRKDTDKMKEAIDLMFEAMDENGWNYDIDMNLYCARANLICGDMYSAAFSYLYQGDVRLAYCTAHHGAKASDDKELARLAAAFAALHLAGNASEHTAEAVLVLKENSVMASDISGIFWLSEQKLSPAVREQLQGISVDISGTLSHTPQEFEAFLKKTSMYYPGTLVQKTILENIHYLPQLDDPEYEEEEKRPDPDETDTSGEADTGETEGYTAFRDYTGTLHYKYLREGGTIELDNGEKYDFQLKDVSDESLKNQLRKINSSNIKPIPAVFWFKSTSKGYAVQNIRRGSEPTPAPVVVPKSITVARSLFEEKDFEGTIALCRDLLSGGDKETALTLMLQSYLRLRKANDNMGYEDEIEALITHYYDPDTDCIDLVEAVHVYYTRTSNHAANIETLNRLKDMCGEKEQGRYLHYLVIKAACYRSMEDYPSAVSELLDWLDVCKRYKLTDRKQQRDTLIYVELAELYYLMEDYENSEKYANRAFSNDRRNALLEKLAEIPDPAAEEDAAEESEAADPVVTAEPEPDITLQEAYDAYTDEAGFDALGMTDEDVLNTALRFRPDQLHCTLTYLHTAAELSASSAMERTAKDGETVYVGSALAALNTAFGFAFNSPLLDREYLSPEILSAFKVTEPLMPQINSRLRAAAALYALFGNPSTPDYDLTELAECCAGDDFSSMQKLADMLREFREQTGYGMDICAAYKTGTAALDKIIEELKGHCSYMEQRVEVRETQGRVRMMRELLFDAHYHSEIRTCLDIAAANDTAKYQYVKDTISSLFIRSGRTLSAENIDTLKLDKYIDRYWDLALIELKKENNKPKNERDNLKSSRRTNLFTTLRSMISSICDWIAAAAYAISNDTAYLTARYQDYEVPVRSSLDELIRSCETEIALRGFDWGTESIRRAAAELRSKMDGTYDSRNRKYLFVPFLTGEEILLNENYLPETQSTFCDMPDFNIFSRIEDHAAMPVRPLEERISEIFSAEEMRHDFRSAALIRDYGKDMHLTAITEHRDLSQFSECEKQAKQRFEAMYRDFSDELELFESYGTLSDINGEKSSIVDLAQKWYCICRLTNDYGFYARLLEIIRSTISANAAEKGERLMKELEELADKPEYDFGVFSKEAIAELISDQNYSSASFYLNSIRRGDTKAVADYSAVPFGYFSEFINEHATNYRAVFGAGKSLKGTVLAYSGIAHSKDDRDTVQKALNRLTNNARKETKGGANLICGWVPKGGPANPEMLSDLLDILGFHPDSVQRDVSVEAEAYQVFCRKRTGKVSYTHPIPAFGSQSEREGFRILCLYGKFDCSSLMDKFRSVNTTAKNTLVLLDYALNMEERRKLARKIKEEKSFSKTFIVIDRVILFYLAKHYEENTVTRRMLAVTMPFAYYQPFVESSTQTMPPELFTGREAELTSIEDITGANLVYGGRQLGKSALLKMAQQHIDKNGNGDRAVLVEIKDMNTAKAAELVSRKLILAGILDGSCQCDNWSVLAGHIERRLMDENPETRINYLLLMLDEADEFIRTSGETEDQPISALKNLPSDRFKIVMAGLHNLSRYNRELMHGNSNLIHLNAIVVKQFRREEATKLLTNTLAYLGFRFNDQIISNILASTNYYPGLIQFYCQKLLEAMKNEDYAGYNETRTPNYEVTEEHFKKVLSDKDFMDKVNEKLEATLFAEEKGRSNYHIVALLLAFLYYTVPSDKGYTIDELLRVAQEYRIRRLLDLRMEQLVEILQEMWDLNVLTVMDGCYSFATDGFRNLLGSLDTIEEKISDYMGEGEA